ncbi:hypothetical protein [Methylobacterium soli]|uniref:MFS transporter n=1 Tax=Methylobacterium soli TaxID=553447 RepID=A0A6L3T0U3_9HYPH|nr:hypothetical protein [Methylobacterium soli]KAB1078220.1 hypothetical protein F6X53_15820 [Methylobacterium soli]GJE40871.1 hypothetical protein AEGHOMDF_0029 [Methylobacterium soli]
MNKTLSLAWTRAQALSRRWDFQRLFLLVLTLDALCGAAALAEPASTASLLGLEAGSATGWIQALGGLLLLAAGLQLPGLSDPVGRRWGNLAGLLGRLVLCVLCLFLGGGFALLALVQGGLSLALAVLYFQLFRAELMSCP